MSKYTTEVTQRVFDDTYGYCIVIGEDSSGINHVSIYYSEDGTPKTRHTPEIVISPEMALLVANAIEKQARYIIDREKEREAAK